MASPNPAGGSGQPGLPFSFDHDAIAEVARRLRLTWPITIVVKHGVKRSDGTPVNGRLLYSEGEHVIELDVTRPADDVNRTLAH